MTFPMLGMGLPLARPGDPSNNKKTIYVSIYTHGDAAYRMLVLFFRTQQWCSGVTGAILTPEFLICYSAWRIAIEEDTCKHIVLSAGPRRK